MNLVTLITSAYICCSPVVTLPMKPLQVNFQLGVNPDVRCDFDPAFLIDYRDDKPCFQNAAKPGIKESGKVKRWVLPVTVTIGAGVGIYLLYRTRGR